MENVQRYDSCRALGGAVKDADGFLRDSPVVARTGVYTYVNPDRTVRREYRPTEEVFSDASLASYAGKPVTAGHPACGKVTSVTARSLAIGSILSPGYSAGKTDASDEMVGCDIVLFTPEAIGEARGLSLGYRCDVEETPGVTALGERYDAIQRNIRVNHLAVVKRARAGVKARLNCDGDEYIPDEDFYKEAGKMSMYRIDGIDYELQESVVNHIRTLEQRCDAAEANVLAMTTVYEGSEKKLKEQSELAAGLKCRVDELEKENDGLKEEADEKEEALDESKLDAEESRRLLEEAEKKCDEAERKLEELSKKAEEAQAKYDEAVKERDALEAKLDVAREDSEKAIAKAKDEARAEMQERRELEETAEEAGLKDYEALSNKELKAAIVKALRPDFSPEGKTDAYMDAAYDLARESIGRNNVREQMQKAMGTKKAAQARADEDSSSSARERMAERLREAYASDSLKY